MLAKLSRKVSAPLAATVPPLAATVPPVAVALLLATALLVAGCHAPKPESGAAAAASPLIPEHVPPPPPPLPPPPRGLPTYRIDAAQSSLRVLVYRAGTMASLGHDHVIENHALDGWIGLAPRAEDTSFYLRIPVAAFVVDDEAARAAAGPEFAEPVGGDAKEGTRRNMLGPALLDAEHHPTVAVRSMSFAGTEPDLVARVAIETAGRSATLTIPIRVTRGQRSLTASADFSVRQTALGLTPFSVMLGALRVADEIKLRLTLVAIPE